MLAAFACALLARCLHLWSLEATPYLDALVVDALGFEEDARLLVAQGWSFPDAFQRPPLYIYVRAALSWLGMDATRTLSAIHCLVGALTAALLALLTFRLSAGQDPAVRQRATWIAGLVAALYGPLIANDVELLASVWVHALLAVSLVLVATPAERLRRSDAPAGLALGLAITGWAPAVAFVVPIAMLRVRHALAPERAKVAAVLLLCASVAPALSAAHNASHGAPLSIVSANGGMNLWLGNNPKWQDTWAAGPGLYFDREEQRPSRAGARTWGQKERWYSAAVWGVVKADPGAAALRVLKKLGCALHGTEISRDHDREWLRRQSPLIAATMFGFVVQFPFGLLLPLALLCPRQRLHPGTYAALLAGSFAYALVLALWFVAMRYRLLLVLLLLPLAASALAGRLRDLPKLQWVVGGIALLACNLPNALAERVSATPVQELIRLRQSFTAQQKLDEAMSCSRQAVKADPDDADGQVALGIDLLTAGDNAQAYVHLQRATELLPDSEAAWHYFGNGCLAVQKHEQAVVSFQRALAINPFHEQSYRDLARTQLALGLLWPALATLKQAQQAGFWDLECGYDLANQLYRQGHRAEATELAQSLQRRQRAPYGGP